MIGTTKHPENGELKDYKTFYNKFLYIPCPDYQSRLLIWKHYIEERLLAGLETKDDMAAAAANGGEALATNNELIQTTRKPAEIMAQQEENRKQARVIMDRMDISSLAHISEGYAAGAIARTVRNVITWRRVAVLRMRPLTTTDFIDALSTQDVVYQDEKHVFRAFMRAITGIVSRSDTIKAAFGGM